MLLIYLFLCSCCIWQHLSLVEAARRIAPPRGALIVSKSPGQGQFNTIQGAIDSLSTTSEISQVIFIYPGTYQEQVTIPERTASLTIYGYTRDARSYTSNTVTITQSKCLPETTNDDNTATVQAWAKGLKMYNINIQNTYGPGYQAVALAAEEDQQGYYGVRLDSYQDTLLANRGNQIYAHSYIGGAVDFIWGQQARAWFQNVDIAVKGPGAITANGRDSESNVSFYVFHNCNIETAAGYTVQNGVVHLGRPWRSYARVVYQYTQMSAVIDPAGWCVWANSDPRTDHVFYKEFQNTGVGSQGQRAVFAGYLSGEVGISSILGYDYASWVDTAYL